MKQEEWKIADRISKSYSSAMSSTMRKLLKGIDKEDDIVSAINKILSLKSFTDWAEFLAYNMINRVYKSTYKSWREAAQDSNRGKLIYQLLKKELQGPVGATVNDLIIRNSRLIKSLPVELGEEISIYIQKRTVEGVRPEQIKKEIMVKAPQLTEARAKLIARTETSKAHTALTEARSLSLNIPAYVWRTSKDERVRDSHKHMEGVVIFWNDPPNPEKLIGKKSYGNYHAGNIFNDRCYPSPIIILDDLTFPVKVYRNGNIVKMSKKQLSELMGVK